MNARRLGLVLAAAAAALVLWLWPRGPKNPEAEVRQIIGDIVAGAERREIGALADAMADDFRGPQGATKAEVKQIVAYQVLRNQETVAIFNPSLEVKLRGTESADIEGTFLFARSKAKSATELDPSMVASAYRITATLDKRGGEWKFISATYAPVSWP